MKLKVPVAPPAKASWMFEPIARPAFTDSLRFPDDITKVPPHVVSELHGKYTAMYAYAAAELSKIKQSILRLKSEQYIAKLNIQRAGYTHNRRKGEIDTDVRLDMKLQKYEQQVIELEQQDIHVSSRIEIFDRYMSALSRELTRRTSEMHKT